MYTFSFLVSFLPVVYGVCVRACVRESQEDSEWVPSRWCQEAQVWMRYPIILVSGLSLHNTRGEKVLTKIFIWLFHSAKSRKSSSVDVSAWLRTTNLYRTLGFARSANTGSKDLTVLFLPSSPAVTEQGVTQRKLPTLAGMRRPLPVTFSLQVSKVSIHMLQLLRGEPVGRHLKPCFCLQSAQSSVAAADRTGKGRASRRFEQPH